MVGFGGWMPSVVDIVVAVETLGSCTGSDGECYGCGELWFANTCM